MTSGIRNILSYEGYFHNKLENIKTSPVVLAASELYSRKRDKIHVNPIRNQGTQSYYRKDLSQRKNISSFIYELQRKENKKQPAIEWVPQALITEMQKNEEDFAKNFDGDIVVGVHGFGGHATWLRSLAHETNENDALFYALDLKGFGKNNRAPKGSEINHPKGHIDDFSDWLDGVEDFFWAIRERYPKAKISLFGHSLGGIISFLTAHRKSFQEKGFKHGMPKPIKKLILSVPGFGDAGGFERQFLKNTFAGLHQQKEAPKLKPAKTKRRFFRSKISQSQEKQKEKDKSIMQARAKDSISEDEKYINPFKVVDKFGDARVMMGVPNFKRTELQDEYNHVPLIEKYYKTYLDTDTVSYKLFVEVYKMQNVAESIAMGLKGLPKETQDYSQNHFDNMETRKEFPFEHIHFITAGNKKGDQVVNNKTTHKYIKNLNYPDSIKKSSEFYDSKKMAAEYPKMQESIKKNVHDYIIESIEEFSDFEEIKRKAEKIKYLKTEVDKLTKSIEKNKILATDTRHQEISKHRDNNDYANLEKELRIIQEELRIKQAHEHGASKEEIKLQDLKNKIQAEEELLEQRLEYYKEFEALGITTIDKQELIQRQKTLEKKVERLSRRLKLQKTIEKRDELKYRISRAKEELNAVKRLRYKSYEPKEAPKASLFKNPLKWWKRRVDEFLKRLSAHDWTYYSRAYWLRPDGPDLITRDVINLINPKRFP